MAFDIAGKQPRLLASLHPALGNVMQNVIQEPVSGDFYVSQNTGVDAAPGMETNVVSRLGADGSFKDSMTLLNAGHGTDFGVEVIGGKVNLWWTWQEPAPGGYRNDIVRFEYRANDRLARADVARFTVLPKFVVGDTYVTVALDWPNGYAAYRTSTSKGETYTRRKIADVKAGTDATFGTVFLPLDKDRVMQSFSSLGDTLYYYSGTNEPESGRRKLTAYSWSTAAVTNEIDTNDLGRTDNGSFPDDLCEPEGTSVYIDSSGNPTILVGIVAGGHTINRVWNVYTFVTPAPTSAPPKPTQSPATTYSPGTIPQQAPLPGSRWRYIAQRALTGEFLDYEVPMERDELTWALSGAGSLKASISPDVGRLRASDGGLLLEEWGTLLYAEADGQIRWGGILISSTFDQGKWSIEAAGFTTYPHGIPYSGDYSRIGVDPADVVREIWSHVQSFGGGDLGVTVDSDPTPVRLGKAAIPAIPQVYLDGKWQNTSAVPASRILKDASVPLAASMLSTDKTLTLTGSLGDMANSPLPFDVKVGSETITVTGVSGQKLTGLTRGVGSSTPAAHAKGTKVNFTGTKTQTIDKVDAEPFLLSWWDSPDCGGEIDSLAQETPFDYTEHHAWSGDSITHTVQIAYPRLGSRRDDLAFVQGDNVISVVTPTLHGDDYANEVYGIGAGEGKLSLRRTTAIKDGRLRRPYVYSAKDIKNTARLDALIRQELAYRKNLLEISEVTVRDHPNARLGSWSLGDDVLIQAHVPWLGDISLWCRITAWSLISESTATLSLARSDSFHYGG